MYVVRKRTNLVQVCPDADGGSLHGGPPGGGNGEEETIQQPRHQATTISLNRT